MWAVSLFYSKFHRAPYTFTPVMAHLVLGHCTQRGHIGSKTWRGVSFRTNPVDILFRYRKCFSVTQAGRPEILQEAQIRCISISAPQPLSSWGTEIPGAWVRRRPGSIRKVGTKQLEALAAPPLRTRQP